MTNKYFATVAPSLEEIAAQEIENLGGIGVRADYRGVHFQGDKNLLYRVNLWGRTIYRVLVNIAEVKSENAQQLAKNVKNIHWENYFHPEQTIAVNCTGGNKNLNHTHFTALQIKNAIVDRQQEKTGLRSNINVKNPDVLINAHIHQNYCTLSLDSSGESLHRRGYRPAMGLAPLKETLAAALLEMAEWKPDLTFFDPLCGSGTLVLEATLKALNIAPGLSRQKFGFQSWLDFDSAVWNELVTEAKIQQLSQLPAPIFGSDSDGNVIQQAISNAHNCGVGDDIHFFQCELSQIEAPTDSGIIICNPPYGKRLGNSEALGALYKQLGDVFKQRFKGWVAYVLTGNKQLSKQIGLRTSRRFSVYNGDLPCSFLRYELY